MEDTRAPGRGFSDDEASRIWRRAAELQANRRLIASAERTETAAEDSHSLSRDELLAIAAEAGIEPEFMQQAITEAELTPDTAPDSPPPLRAVRTIEAGPDVVREALQEVAARPPFRLRLTDARIAGDTRVLVFDIGVTDWNSTESTSFRSGDYAAGLIATAIQAVVRPAAARGATDLILQGVPNPNLETSVRRHRYGFGTAGAMAGGAAGFFGASALAVTGAVLAAPALLGAAALGAAGAGMIRGAHNWARRRDQRSIERLADEVAGFTRVRLHLGEPDVRRIEGGS